MTARLIDGSERERTERGNGSASIRHSVRDLLSVLFRHKVKMALFFVSVVVSVAVYSFLVPETYQSEAKLLLRLGRENLSVDPAVTGPTLGALSNRDAEGKTELAILTSRRLAENVVDALHETEPDPSARESAIHRVMSGLNARADLNTDIIELRYTAPSAEVASNVLTTVIDQYLQRHIEVHSTQASPGFFEKQTEQLAEELARAQQELEEFREENGIVSFELQRENLIQQIDDLEVQAQEVTSNVEASHALVSSLSAALRDGAEASDLNWTPREGGTAESLKQKLVNLRIEEMALSSKYQTDHPTLVAAREQIRFIEEALTGAQQAELDQERSQLATYEARQAAIARELDERRARLTQLARSEEKLKNLQLDKELALTEYQQYRESLQRARISAALDVGKVSNVSVIQPATYPNSPISPDRRLNLLLATVLGAVGAVLLAFLADYASDTIKTRDDVERLVGFPVIAGISESEFNACITGAPPRSLHHGST